MDVLGTCTKASENESSQTLAIVMSIVFAVYVLSAILLSSLQLYSVTSAATATATPAVVVSATREDGIGIQLVNVK